ncbi:MAG: FAD-binding oxidoreductase [Evtepia gabavorous]
MTWKIYTVTVQPGVLLQQLAEDALSHGCLYPPDPGEKLATLGGNVSTHASGMRGVKYGATRDYVKAMTVVLPTGDVTQFGSAVSKTSSGYNLLHLMIGSEGTLGIITELTLKLIPAPGATISLVVPFADLPTCISTVPKLRHSHLNPQAIEFFEKEILITSETYLEKQVFPRVIEGTDVGAYLLITFDGDSMEALEPTIERAATLLLEESALDVLVADTPQKLKEAWAARSSFLEGIEEQTKLLDECDVVVPVTKIPDYVVFADQLAKEYDFRLQSFGHAGDATCTHTCSNDMEREEFLQVDDFDQLYAKTMGWAVSLRRTRHRPGKSNTWPRPQGIPTLPLMQGIKAVFDPKMILNPGKIFPMP